MKRHKRILLPCILFILITTISMVACGVFYVPVGIRHFIHLAVSPENLYEPIVIDTFPFWESGFSKSYSLDPKYMDIYELGVLAKGENLSSKENYEGKVKVEFLWKGETILEHVFTSIQRGVYVGKDMTRYKKVSFMDFEIPVQKKYKKDISLKLTVLEADQNLKKYGDSLQMYIAVTPSP